jgi:hypothetical protein
MEGIPSIQIPHPHLNRKGMKKKEVRWDGVR